MKLLKGHLIALLLAVFVASLSAQTAHQITTIQTSAAPFCTPWVDSGYKAATTWDPAAPAANYVEIFPATKWQVVYGFGATFFDLAWKAIQRLSPAGQDSVLIALFDTSGCNLNWGRIPIGNCDYDLAVAPYSCNDNAGDTGMLQFSLARDSVRRIPFIKAAQKYQPNMRFWASPWSPPGWLKSNNSYAGSGSNFIGNPVNYRAYARYLSKWVKEYSNRGIDVESITCQNEPDQTSHGYPQCGWASVTMEDTFYRNYMLPQFRQDSVKAKIYIGVQCCKDTEWVTPFFKDTAVGPYVNWTSHSYESTSDGPKFVRQKPGIPFMQSESMWSPSGNSWSVGTTLFTNIQAFMHESTSVYMMWQTISDRGGNNGGYTNSLGAQPEMIYVDTTKAMAVTYAPQFYVVKHYSHFLQPNAHYLHPTAHGTVPNNTAQSNAFINPDGSIVYVATTTSAMSFMLKVGDKAYPVNLPANSFNTVVIRDSTQTPVLESRPLEKAASSMLTNARIHNSMLYFTVSPAAKARTVDLALRNLQGKTVWTGRCSGAVLQGSQFLVIQPGRLHAGTYLLSAKIRNAAGVVSTAESKVMTMN